MRGIYIREPEKNRHRSVKYTFCAGRYAVPEIMLITVGVTITRPEYQAMTTQRVCASAADCVELAKRAC